MQLFFFKFFFRNEKPIIESRQSVETYEFKIFRKLFQKPAQNWEKTAEELFLRVRFHLMRQSELKVRAKKQF